MINWKVYENKSVIELIELIKMNRVHNHLDSATVAFEAFCFRFQFDLIRITEHICKNNGYDKIFAIEVVEKTFQKFWKYPGFDQAKVTASTPEKGVLIYLSRIAQHSFYDLVNEKRGINISPYNGEEMIIYDIPLPKNEIETSNTNYILLKQVFNTLSWKHKVVYLTYLAHENNGYKLPRKLLSELRTKLGISQETVRFYRYEVVTKIREYKELWSKK